MISTVDPQARHGHKTAARGFDGYKGHVGIDPDSEIITATQVTPGNAGDASVAEDLIADLLPEPATDPGTEAEAEADTEAGADAGQGDSNADAGQGEAGRADGAPVGQGKDEDPVAVYGDNAYGTGEFQERLADAGIESRCKTQRPTSAGGLFTKDDFDVDLDTDTVTCPNSKTAPIQRNKDDSGAAQFAKACADCPLRAQCTKAPGGRSIKVGRHERRLAEARERQTDPDWLADYRATRPKVERKFGHLMRRRHGGRLARVRGQIKIGADFALLAAAVNLARFAVLGVATVAGCWAVAPR